MKLNKSIIILCALVAVFLTGCKDSLASVSSKTNETAITAEPETASGRITLAYSEALESVFETVGEYVTIETDARSASEASEDIFTLIDSSLPKDISTLKRTRISESRSCEEEDVSLLEELEEIGKKWNETIQENIPDLTSLESLDGVLVQDGILYMGNGDSVRLDTLQGIVTAEVLLEIANGETPENAATKISEDIESLFSQESDARALYMYNAIIGVGKTWSNGVVNYIWGDMSDEHKQAMEEAMATWNASVGVTFRNLEEHPVLLTLAKIGLYPSVTYKDAELTNALGVTFPLGEGLLGTLKISTTIADYNLDMTCLHELGHVLGLQHEHQRNDRDTYITVTDEQLSLNYLNYMKIPEYIGGLTWESRTGYIGPKKWNITYTYWVLVWNPYQTRVSVMHGDFDFDSIMLYNGFVIKAPYDNSNYGVLCIDGAYRTKANDALSQNDIETVKEMYE